MAVPQDIVNGVFVMINPDNTINYIGTDISDKSFADVDVVVVYNKTIAEILNGVDPMHAVWDDDNEICLDVTIHPHLIDDNGEFARDLVRDKINEVDQFASNPLIYSELSEAEVSTLKDYRRKLKSLATTPDFPANIHWPVKPDILNKDFI
jgi:hypothetical protein